MLFFSILLDMMLIKNGVKLVKLGVLNRVIQQNERLIYSKSSNLFRNDNASLNDGYTMTGDTKTKQNLPVIIPATFYEKLKEALGFQGGLKYSQPVLTIAAFNLYMCVQYQIDFDKVG